MDNNEAVNITSLNELYALMLKREDRIYDAITGLNQKIDEVKEELRKEIKETKEELRAEFRKALEETKEELRIEFRKALEETKEELRAEIEKAKEELRAEFRKALEETKEELRAEIEKAKEELRAEFKTALEETKEDILNQVSDFFVEDVVNDVVHKREFRKLEKDVIMLKKIVLPGYVVNEDGKEYNYEEQDEEEE